MNIKRKKQQYLGSVLFFKHVILASIILIVLSLLTTAIVLNKKNNQLSSKLVQLTGDGQISGSAVENIKLDYQKKFPKLYVERKAKTKSVPQKTIFLTFDDGPSRNTMDILDILSYYDLKATFFVVYNDNEDSKHIYQEIVKRGHTIAIHTASHKYNEIYQSVDSFLEDFNKVFTKIEELTGVKPDILRLPGGSINPYNVNIHQELLAELLRRGFTFHDWNVSGNDTGNSATSYSIYQAVVNNASKNDRSVVLLHDLSDKDITVEALENIIVDLKDKGYSFEKLDGSIVPFTFAY